MSMSRLIVFTISVLLRTIIITIVCGDLFRPAHCLMKILE